jgi:putative phage-type endonuclease
MKMKIHNDIQQRTEEWHRLRALRLTASKANTIKANGKGLDTYCLEIVASYLSSADNDSYQSEAMKRGCELEDEARAIYEIQNNVNVSVPAFISEGDYIGCSPDGLVGEDGMIEIKCLTDKVYLEYLISRKIDVKYFDQMQMQMLVAKRNWCDYVVYNPNFKEDMIVQRVTLDIDTQNKIKQGCISGENKIKMILENLKKRGVAI